MPEAFSWLFSQGKLFGPHYGEDEQDHAASSQRPREMRRYNTTNPSAVTCGEGLLVTQKSKPTSPIFLASSLHQKKKKKIKEPQTWLCKAQLT